MNTMSVDFSLTGKQALVTGASSGLGRHFSKVLARAGAHVFVAARRFDRLHQLVEEIRNAQQQATALVLDITDRSSIDAALDSAGPLDVLVNNAGISQTTRLLDYTDESWNDIVATNLNGNWKIAQSAARRMVDAKIAGSIINVTSILASRVAGGVAPYAAAKAGLRQLTRSMALELARFGIRVNSLAPGYIATELNEDFLSTPSGESLRSRIPLQRFGNYADLDGPLLLLASGAGRYLTGSEIVVDGGHLCSGL